MDCFLVFFYLHPLVQHEITIIEFPEVFQEVAHTSYNSASSDEENNPPVPRQKVECVFSNMAAHTVSSKHFVLWKSAAKNKLLYFNSSMFLHVVSWTA